MVAHLLFADAGIVRSSPARGAHWLASHEAAAAASRRMRLSADLDTARRARKAADDAFAAISSARADWCHYAFPQVEQFVQSLLMHCVKEDIGHTVFVNARDASLEQEAKASATLLPKQLRSYSPLQFGRGFVTSLMEFEGKAWEFLEIDKADSIKLWFSAAIADEPGLLNYLSERLVPSKFVRSKAETPHNSYDVLTLVT